MNLQNLGSACVCIYKFIVWRIPGTRYIVTSTVGGSILFLQLNTVRSNIWAASEELNKSPKRNTERL